jgi:hypothetical protein
MSFGSKKSGMEKRAATRHPGNFSAMIILDTGERIPCVVKDFSKTGAQLLVATVLGIPAEFNLQAATGQIRRVQVMRRATSRLGVRFI